MNSFLKRFLSMTLVLTVVTSAMTICAQDADKITADNQIEVDTKAEAETDETVATDSVVTTDETSEETEKISYAETLEERREKDAESLHVFTGREITKIPDEMREPNTYGGSL